jgi:siroheme synthase-like protein
VNFRYPIFLDLTGKRCLVIGEGPETAAKIQSLHDAGAIVEWRADDSELNGFSDCFLVIANLPDNSRVFRFCEERRILCNSVDNPGHCRFIFGSVHRVGDLSLAISTNGIAPALAVRLREQFQREIGPEYGQLLALLKEVRGEIAARIPDFSMRRELWYQILDSNALDLVRSGQLDTARTIIQQLINSTSRSDTSGGDVRR